MSHKNLFASEEENHSEGKILYHVHTKFLDPDSQSFDVHFDSDEECIAWIEGRWDWWRDQIGSIVRWSDGYGRIWPTPDSSVILRRQEEARKKAITEQIKRDLESSKSNGLFDGAYFGKPYETRNGEKAILIQLKSHLFVLEDLTEYFVHEDGHVYDGTHEDDYDIIGEWKKQIDGLELEKLAIMENPNTEHSGDTYESGLFYGFDDGFKAGYRKAKEE